MRKFVGPAAVAVALSIGAPGSHGLTLDYKTITTKFDVDVASQLSVEVASAFVKGAAGASLRIIRLSAAAGR
jgi:hypothetical protein